MVKDYVAWATQRAYAIIDVNIPKHVTVDTSNVGKYEEEDVDRPSQTEELAGYLWDNYIEYDLQPRDIKVVETDSATGQMKLPMSSSLESATRSMAWPIFLSTEVSSILVMSYMKAEPQQTASTNASTA